MKNNYTLFSILLWGLQPRKPKVSLNRQLGHGGFMLIELIIATLIASMIGTLLLTILFQSTQMQVAVDEMIDTSERIGIVVNVLEKDLAGAFVPTQSEQKNDMHNKLAEQSENADKKDTGSQQAPAKKEKKTIEKIFYSTSKNGMLDTLTLITNNPLVVFVGKDVGVVKPNIVRVQYTLKPEPEDKNSYALFRQESNEIDLAEYKNVRPYQVIGGIKKLTVTFTARIEKPSSADKTADAPTNKTKEKQKKEYEYKTQPEWVSEQKQAKNKESDKKEAEFPRIPYSVEFKITLWDKLNQREKEFIFVCSIPVDSLEAEQKDEKKDASPKKEPQKPEKGSDKSPPGKSGQQNAMNGKRVEPEVIVYNEIEVLNNALSSLKKLLGQG